MKKEVVISVLIGLTLGLIITYGIYRMRTALTAPPESGDIEATASPSPTPANNSLTVLSPLDGTIQTGTSLTVTGTAPPNSIVVLFVDEEDQITTADDSGNFSFIADLETGSNVLTVHTVDENGISTSVERVVIVNPGQLASPTNASPAAGTTATPSASPTNR